MTTKSSDSKSEQAHIHNKSTHPTVAMDERDSVIQPMIHGLKVLVLGEHDARQNTLADELKSKGVRAYTAPWDKRGYITALKTRPDVVVSQMARPGDTGWWLLQRIHRHPVLCWTPVLLMNWWKEQDGEEITITNIVLERLAESLAPIRVLEERIAAGRKLHDRIEVIGIESLLGVLSDAELTGRFTVNDSWNMFEVEMTRGKLSSIIRNGVDGGTDTGETAFMQLMVTTSGNWTFRSHDSAPRPVNLNKNLSQLVEMTSAQLSEIIGPEVTRENALKLRIKHDIAAEICGELHGLTKEIASSIVTPVSKDALVALLNNPESSRPEVELTVQNMLRKGAVYPAEKQDKTDALNSWTIPTILQWLGDDHRMEEPPDVEPTGKHHEKSATAGFYSLHETREEKLTSAERNARTRQLVTSSTVELQNEENWEPPAELFEDTGAGESDNHAWRRNYQEEQPGHNQTAKPYDSLAPDPDPEHGNKLNMIIAVTIALLMAVVLITGLVLVASDPPDRNRDKSEASR